MTSRATDDQLESAIARGLSFNPSADARTHMDRRVEDAIVAESRRRVDARRRSFSRPRRLIVGVVAATLLLAGTVTAAGTLLDRLVADAPLLESVWSRATPVRQTATDSGYTLTLEKAAADSERIWVALTVSGGADIAALRIIDGNGVVMGAGTGAGTGVAAGASALLFGFAVPDGITPAGPFTLEVTGLQVAGEQRLGDWSFAFDVPLTRP